MPRVHYQFFYEMPVENLSPEVGKIFSSLNQSMREFGFTEKIGMGRVRVATGTLDVDRELTPVELTVCNGLIIEATREKMPAELGITVTPLELVP